jgi:L-ascorbate metabolism protein UlaG (beta-lactamase superfamily)
MNHGGKWNFPFGTVKFVHATHSSVMPDGTYGGNPGGFVIWNEEGCLYVAGDTDLTMDMQLIPLTCPPLDAAILPVGDNFTMGFQEALLAAEFVRCDTVIGCHFDTFPYIVIPRQEAEEAFRSKNKRLILPVIGRTVTFR